MQTKIKIFNPFLNKTHNYKSLYDPMPMKIYRYMISMLGYPISILPGGVKVQNGRLYLEGKRGESRATKIKRLEEQYKSHNLTLITKANRKEQQEEKERRRRAGKGSLMWTIDKIYFRRWRRWKRRKIEKRKYFKTNNGKATMARSNKKRRGANTAWLKKYRSNVLNRIWENIKERERKALKSQKANRTYSFTDSCTKTELENHLKKNWDPWMNWDNYGEHKKMGEKSWQIDHIKEVYKFNLKDPLQQKTCFEIQNLQPYEKYANMEKGGFGISCKQATTSHSGITPIII